MKEYIHIGKLVAVFGVKGELILKHSLGKKSNLKEASAIFVEETKGSYIPYFLETAKAKDEEETFIKLEGVNSKEAAARFTAKPVWLLDADFRKLAGKDAPISLLGYEVITDEDENLGPIEEVIEQPHQVLLRVTLEGNEALIPLHAETLDKIDRVAQKVYVTLPDGLLDIYRGL
ncbi:ribosome maturation factor RimM [Sediminibacterium sp.]|jgi:16S rRNA processing protein RimM|uniref:ribosome maturation factor RimM n=1 Tax=Sediminibacterium sp. TaxID=1917865 RepID=UPI000BD2B3E0|nr:ribosome maturation factor RimM [Sediminibacterium sp.]OYW79104.1 MAG: 16S rRNA processing protein RimM [Sphingobacteriia bacterium 32-37-4]OYY10938.1 MAG: 16S rRNA processing protein RimM [Sphingobacteriia bacterium 35-36-14]OYZ02171.1 MAG: 16S rRNA processing protein RimM [Sphingobacteriia bacterium 28-36-52]OYZ54204.1 MAG: 16S rRNA processing protein RimM [Sphingobacteriia bacterium 24-36-13]OZA65627.1 MAG: 16S rRNA processing protein RimM [Sphingobacteriia bacterium 39-36-14]